MTLSETKAPLLNGFPARLRELREKKRLSQADLASLVGVSKNHIGRYERGDSQPTFDKIKKLAEVLGVSGDYLLDSTSADIARESLETRELLELFTEVEKLDAKDREMVKRFLTALLSQKKLKELAAL